MTLPTSTDLELQLSQSFPTSADALAVALTENPDTQSLNLPEAERAVVGRLVAGGVFRGKSREVAGELLEHRKGLRHILAGGLGAAEKRSLQALREFGAAIARAARKRGVKHLAILVPDAACWTGPEAVEALATGVKLALYRFTECKGTGARKDKDEPLGPATVTLVVNKVSPASRQSLDRAEAIVDAQNFARTIAYRPGNQVNPPELARIAQDAAKRVGLNCLDECTTHYPHQSTCIQRAVCSTHQFG